MDIELRSTGRTRRIRWIAALASAFALALGSATAVAATAEPAVPSRAEVRAVMHGAGHWHAYRADVAALGSKPRGCRSDKQLQSYDDIRARGFYGRERSQPRSIYSGAEIVVLTYADAAAASDVVARHATYPKRCPKVTEWTCIDCDGIATTWRTRVAMPRVGQESVGWRFRSVGNLKSSGYAVVARRGPTVVRVTVTRTRDVFGPHGWRYPTPMKKAVASRLAKLTLSGGSPRLGGDQ